MNVTIFQRALMSYFRLIWIPFGVLLLLTGLNNILGRDVLGGLNWDVLGIPLISSNVIGLGIISIGGLAVGFLALGGGACVVIAVGGGAIGLVAIGGGAIGVIAMGGGAAGLIAVGGGAAGYYVLAGSGRGKHVLSYTRQDPQAVQFFCKYLPRLREAFESGELAQDPQGNVASPRA